MAHQPQSDEKETDWSKFFTSKPLFGDPEDFGVLVNNAAIDEKNQDEKTTDVIDEDECEQEACIIDDQGHVTTDNYNLNKKDFKDWSINLIVKKSNMSQLIKNKNKTFNPNTAFWKFIKQKTSNQYNNCVNMCKEKVDKLKEKQSSLIRNMSFDDISAITLYTTSEFYRPLNSSLRSRKDEWAPFCGPLLSGLNKLPFVWQKLYRGTKSKTVKKRIEESYKVGAIVRWDSFTSTSTDKNVATNGFFCGAGGTVFEIESGFRGRDIELFSAVQSEKEILFSVSSHFVITYIDTSAERCIVKLKELPFPWDSKTILWVDDIPTNNKGIMEEFEANGIMVIPRISTFGAKEFLDFTKNAINLNTFGKFRVITDMYRMEWPKDDTSKEQVKDKYAGVTLISELRNVGYNNKICIYTGNKEKAVNKCEERNVYDNRVLVTTSPSEVKKYGSFQ